MIVLDVECYRDYFLIAFKHLPTGKVKHFEMYPGKELDRGTVAGTMRKYTTISFNGWSYDLPMITAALQGWDNQALKNLSDSIITSGKKSWMVCKDNQLEIPQYWDHIDVFEVAPGVASLKVYGGRLGAPKMQGLPIAPGDSIPPETRPLMRSYCVNDLDTTQALYEKLIPVIELRAAMSAQYGMDLRSKSDAQIAEAVIKSEVSKRTGKRYYKPEYPEGVTFQYQDPGFASFRSEELRTMFSKILAHPFEVAGNGQIKMPPWLKNTKITIGFGQYQMGIGGLHSCEKSQLVDAEDGILCDLDVSSYYPSIILQQRLAPESMGVEFLRVYQSLVTRRLEAKKRGDKVTADTVKICVNGSFGKLGSAYSALYSPNLLLQTTVTGQIALLMLIERMEDAGIRIVSANTDGIVCKAPKKLERDLELVAWEWSLDTSYALERTDYRRLASRDVNNYVAIKPDGTTKGKGCFGKTGIQKNPDRAIVYEAVVNALVFDQSPETTIAQTIQGCMDIQKFVTVRKVQGGATWRGTDLGKAVRFYSSVGVPEEEGIQYTMNGNKVAKSGGCRPLMDLPEGLPSDINYGVYQAEALKLLKEVGYE